jgi:NADP-dependent 3-hydroxy acid dehydrogenase YdfG
MIENRRTAVGPKAIAAAVAYAIDAPLDVDANEIVIRPTSQR